MLITEIMNALFSWCPMERNNVSDVLVYGDPFRNAEKVAVCMIATPDVLKRAADWGADFLITHEPTFHDAIAHFADGDIYSNDPVYLAKKELIQKLDIPIYRFHDHSHFTQVDKIHAGLVKKLGFPGEFDGIRTLILDRAVSVDELEKIIAVRLGLKHIRFVGQRNKSVKSISLCAGAWGEKCLYEQLNRSDVDVVICGEICEWSICEYVRDSAQLGMDKALFILGHMGSEKCGMEYVSDYINENISGVTAAYFECEEVYQ